MLKFPYPLGIIQAPFLPEDRVIRFRCYEIGRESNDDFRYIALKSGYELLDLIDALMAKLIDFDSNLTHLLKLINLGGRY